MTLIKVNFPPTPADKTKIQTINFDGNTFKWSPMLKGWVHIGRDKIEKRNPRSR